MTQTSQNIAKSGFFPWRTNLSLKRANFLWTRHFFHNYISRTQKSYTSKPIEGIQQKYQPAGIYRTLKLHIHWHHIHNGKYSIISKPLRILRLWVGKKIQRNARNSKVYDINAGIQDSLILGIHLIWDFRKIHGICSISSQKY